MKIIKNTEYYRDLFHQVGLKYTPVRESIYKIIQKSKKPISSLDILSKLEKEFFLNKTTLYRNIDLLKNSNLIDANNYGHSHIHCEIAKNNKKTKNKILNIRYKLICNKCETFEDINLKLDPKNLLKILNKNENFKSSDNKNLKNIRVDIFCDCNKCV
jgi:Fe2+ or Zn2+ uptake regulation protein